MGIGLREIVSIFPEVKGPKQKRLSFKQKLKWTLIILISFYLLGLVPLFGLGVNALQQFEQLSIILGANFGSIISLGIGPIVTASIVLQLLTGSGILKIDTNTPEGKSKFQSLQKLMTVFFIVFEAIIYVYLGGLAPSANLAPATFQIMQILLVGQLILGGFMIMYMDMVLQKWGFIGGISLFIAAGVASQIVVRAFSPLTTAGTLAWGSSQAPVGKVWVLFQSLLGGNPVGAFLAFSTLLATIVVFVLSVYGQAMKIEIPLSFGRVRGHGIRWPLKFMYTSNIPVILVAALMANLQLWARLLQNIGRPILGTFAGNTPQSGLVRWIATPNLVESIITGSASGFHYAQALVYTLFLVGGAIIFSIFWVQTSGQNAKSVAKQILSSGFQMPGFRRDHRILQHMLQRYIFPLTILGGALVGLLAATADLLGALSRGTGILLAVMIVYQLYENIAKQHMMDMHPAMRKFMGNE